MRKGKMRFSILGLASFYDMMQSFMIRSSKNNMKLVVVGKKEEEEEKKKRVGWLFGCHAFNLHLLPVLA